MNERREKRREEVYRFFLCSFSHSIFRLTFSCAEHALTMLLPIYFLFYIENYVVARLLFFHSTLDIDEKASRTDKVKIKTRFVEEWEKSEQRERRHHKVA